MPGPYTRPSGSDPANDASATDATVVVDALSDGLEAVESGVRNVLGYGVVRDGGYIRVSTTAGSTVITALGSGTFTAADVGKALHIPGGTGSGWHRTTITAYLGSTQVQVASAPAATIASVFAVYGTDNTAAINTIISDHLLNGEVLYFPPGDMGYLTSGGHSVTQESVSLRGGGRDSTRIITTATAGYVFTLSGIYSSLRGLTIEHGSLIDYWNSGSPLVMKAGARPTSGGGVLFSAPGRQSGGADNCYVRGMYVGVNLYAPHSWVRDSEFSMFVRAGVECGSDEWPDFGHYVITGNLIEVYGGTLPADYGILWRGSGGLDISGNQINGGGGGTLSRGVACHQTITGTTGNIRINNNAFEDVAPYAIDVTVSSGNHALGYITINGNVFQGGATAWIRLSADAYGADRQGQGDYGITGVSVVGNSAKGGSVLVSLTRVRRAAVGGNTSWFGGTLLTQSACADVTTF